MQEQATKIEPAVWSVPETARYLGISRRTLDELHENDPTFPRKVYFSQRSVFFRKASIDKWLEEKEKGAA